MVSRCFQVLLTDPLNSICYAIGMDICFHQHGLLLGGSIPPPPKQSYYFFPIQEASWQKMFILRVFLLLDWLVSVVFLTQSWLEKYIVEE
jgi:hypothetical protein